MVNCQSSIINRQSSIVNRQSPIANRQSPIVNRKSKIVNPPSVIRLTFDGANPQPTLEGLAPLPGGVNFFLGDDPAQWQNNLPTYEGIVYRDLYPGIDLVYRGTEGRLKSEFVVAPGADPGQIRLRYEGADNLSIRDDGALVIHTSGGELVEAPLLLYQEIEGVWREVEGRYLLLDDNNAPPTNRPSEIVNRKSKIVNPLVSIEVAAYDPAYPLIIDPELVFSSFLGGSSDEQGYDIAVDSIGNIYITGGTRSTDFPIYRAIQNTLGEGGYINAFVTQILNAGGVYTYGFSTYLGGNGFDIGYGIAVDSMHNIYLTGETYSTNFPTQDFIQDYQGHQDAFVTQIISTSGVYTLGYSTYLGGSADEFGQNIAIDSTGNAFVIGSTGSTNFPIRNAIQPTFGGGGRDAFITQIISAGGVYTYGNSTYLGGNDDDFGRGIAVDSTGRIFVTGATSSNDFPTQYTIQDYQGSNDAFVTQIISTSGVYTYGFSTYLGGNDYDDGRGITVDGESNIYLTGETSSTNFPMQHAIQGPQLNGDAFVTYLVRPAGVYTYGYSTCLGGEGAEYGNSIAFDDAGNVYIAGTTYSTDFPTYNAVQDTFGGGGIDTFVTKIITANGVLTYGFSTYLGGSSWEPNYGMAVDRAGNVYVTGSTASTDFPVVNAVQGAFGSGSENTYVAVIRTTTPTCFAQVNSTSATFSSANAQAVQQAVDAAPNGDLVKVAGYCAGINSRTGLTQTVYLSKPLTLRGGYTNTNWTASYPFTQPTMLDAQSAGRVVVITGSAVVTMADLTVTNGKANEGGGIRNTGTLNLRDCVVNGNMALGEDGIDGGYGTDGSPGLGGGISNSGILTINNCTISNNAARGGQGGDSSQDSGGSGGSGMGGGIYSSGNLWLNNCTINYNKAVGGAGGAGYYISFPGYGSGGGVYGRDTMVINNSLVTGNEANSGGGIESNILTQSEAVTVTHTLVSNNSATGLGGGIKVSCHNNLGLTFKKKTNTKILSVGGGGGIAMTHGFFDGAVLLTLQNSTISGNQASTDGGGIFSVNQDMGSNVLTLTNSTISGNKANNQGGGLYFDSNESSTNLMTLINATVVSNSASIGSNITAGSYIYADGTVRLKNTIIAHGLIGENCSILENGKIISEGHNVDGQNTCNLTATGDMTNTNPLLGPLQDNGGTALTHALLPGSPAIDAGDDTGCPATDQRGMIRPQGEHCDIGAYETEAYPFQVAKTAGVTMVSVGQTITYTYRVTNAGNFTLDVSAHDDKLGYVPLNPALLAPNQSATGTLTYTVVEADLPGPLTNTVVVTGTAVGGGAVTATGEASVTLRPVDQPNPAIYLPLIVKNN